MDQQAESSMYLELLKRVITGKVIEDPPKYAFAQASWIDWFRPNRFNAHRRELGERDDLTLALAETGKLDRAGPVVDDRLLIEIEVGQRRLGAGVDAGQA